MVINTEPQKKGVLAQVSQCVRGNGSSQSPISDTGSNTVVPGRSGAPGQYVGLAIDSGTAWCLAQAVDQGVTVNIGCRIRVAEHRGRRGAGVLEARGGNDDVVKDFVATAGKVFPLQREFAIALTVALVVITLTGNDFSFADPFI